MTSVPTGSVESVFVGLFVLAMLIGLYFAPTMLAADRKVPNLGSIAVINVLLGWTLVGWAVALAMAARSVPKPPAAETPTPAKPRDHAEGLAKLADLRTQGLLTDDEFAAAKQRLLSQ